MAQRGNLQRITRLKGPTAVTIRGAGSLGNDPQTKGQFADPAFDIQIPVLQTGNAFQITKPDGTVIYAIGPTGVALVPPVAIAASGAVAVQPAVYTITKAGVAALTLAAPVAGTQDGVAITLISTTAFAHTLTATGLLQTGTAAVNLATFPAFAGASMRLLAYNGKWNVAEANAITFS